MNTRLISTLQQVQELLNQAPLIEPGWESKDECYQWVEEVLRHFRYRSLTRSEKGIIKRYLTVATGYSRAQISRLIKAYLSAGHLKRKQRTSNGFSNQYTKADIRLLAATDQLHNGLNGAAIKKLCERAYVQGDQSYERLKDISVSHIYNLRKSQTYRNIRSPKDVTKPTKRAIGVRRKPRPEGQPGFIRIDTVHQGDQDRVKGVYHINAVDEVTQYQVVCSVEKISETFLIPVLEELLASFPFKLRGFHSDNGSEYINGRVSELLENLRINFTKSRARKTNDNALVESKNGAIIRKILGYAHIPQKYATEINEFNKIYLTPYLNFHRPCFFPETEVDAKGKEKKKYHYENMMTPYEKFKSLPDFKKYLKKGVTLEELEARATSMSDNESAKQLQAARELLFQSIFERKA
ncbi:transposase family protein [Endozoicomonas sp. 4G]|uniref:integrase catalytic domain-containing protein n=1 Tax=Endozoicomonas sp. 4G TaxID=2872754 RepID=UPI0020789205|nr:transposase family protein [Endozoicomonas sp. 4G]